MRLVSIETVNFKKLRHFKADFTDGLNVIVGDNAQGKSTLLQALESALYGSSVVPGKKDKIPTWGQTTWKVVLVFLIGDTEFHLTRTKTAAKLVSVSDKGAESLEANGNTAVTAAVVNLLDLDAKDYNLFMQSKQGETSGVLTFGAAALNRKVEAFAGIDLIDKVQSLSQEEYRDNKSKSEALEVSAAEVQEAESAYISSGDELDSAERERSSAEVELRSLPSPEDLVKPEQDPSAMRRANFKHAAWEKEYALESNNLKHAEDSLKEAEDRFAETPEPADSVQDEKDVIAYDKEAKRLSELVGSLRDDLNSVTKAESKLRKLEESLPDHEVKGALEYRLHAAEEAVEEIDSTRLSLREEGQSLRSQLTANEKMQHAAVCPTCHQSTSDQDPKELEAEAARLEEKIAAIKVSFSATTKPLEESREEAKSCSQEIEERKAAEAEIRETLSVLDSYLAAEEISASIEDATKAQEAALDGKAKKKADLATAEKTEERYSKAKRAVSKAGRSVSASRDSLEALGDEPATFSEDSVRHAEEALEFYSAEKGKRERDEKDARHALHLTELTVASKNKERETLSAALSTLYEKGRESREHAKLSDKAARLSRFLRERRATYLQEVWDSVLGAASKQVSLASKGMIGRLAYEEGDFLFEEEGILAPVASASGAQKAHIGVALRVGLARALYGSDALLIFDEPTESMSEHHASGLTASLAGAASQCLVITHRDQDQDLATNVIEVAA